MNILEPLYEICIDRMMEWNSLNPNLFKEEIGEIKNRYRSNIQYFIYKSIILRNLYGVDIMQEATEIAKLRLFLKMVAVVEVDRRAPNLGLDPLPDIDFNVRCGNTLVGYANEDEIIKDACFADLFTQQEFREKVETEMEKVSKAYEIFRTQQLADHDDLESVKAAKTELKNRLSKLADLLDNQLFSSLGKTSFEAWKKSHQPFHWIAEFYQIIKDNGGFDVIIGNPPYVECTQKKLLELNQPAEVVSSGNLYSAIIFRSKTIINLRSYWGMIVPISFISTEQHRVVRRKIEFKSSVYYSSYDIRPDHLFDGAAQRLTIFISSPYDNIKYTDRQLRWYTVFRQYLFQTIAYDEAKETELHFYRSNKISNRIISKIFSKFSVKDYSGYKIDKFWVATTANNFIKAYNVQPYYYTNGIAAKPSGWRCMCAPVDFVPQIISIINSSTFYYLWKSSSDGFNLTTKFINYFISGMVSDKLELVTIYKKIIKSLEQNSESHIRNQKTTGRTEIQLFRVKPVKPIIDDIDKILAEYYGFTEEELDFIINYDIKYRMGDELNNE